MNNSVILSYFITFIQNIKKQDRIKLDYAKSKYSQYLEYNDLIGGGDNALFEIGLRAHKIKDIITKLKYIIPEAENLNELLNTILIKLDEVYNIGQDIMIQDSDKSKVPILLNNLSEFFEDVYGSMGDQKIEKYTLKGDNVIINDENAKWTSIIPIYQLLLDEYDELKEKIDNHDLSTTQNILNESIQNTINHINQFNRYLEKLHGDTKKYIDVMIEGSELYTLDDLYIRYFS